jgi:DNA-directed RNA polymerase subunit RPC12/RpoP
MCRAPQNKFYYNTKEPHNKGEITCPKCGNKQHPKDVAGMYFLLIEYEGGTGGNNWQCGNCECRFIFHDGETEGNIQCPSCGWFKPTNDTTQEIIIAEEK